MTQRMDNLGLEIKKPVMSTVPEIETVAETVAQVRAEISKAIVGQNEVVEGVLIAILAGGHVLLEGVPGLGKTMLVRTLAQTRGAEIFANSVHAGLDAGRRDRDIRGSGKR